MCDCNSVKRIDATIDYNPGDYAALRGTDAATNKSAMSARARSTIASLGRQAIFSTTRKRALPLIMRS